MIGTRAESEREEIRRKIKTEEPCFPELLVSLRNRTAGRRGRQNACVTNVTGLLLACFVVIFT